MKDIYGIARLSIGESKTFRYQETRAKRRNISVIAHNTKRKHGWKFTVKTEGFSLTVRRIA